MSEGGDGRLLLDTHVWIWFVAGDAKASRCAGLIRDAIAAGAAQVSVLSVWELGMLDAKGRLALSMRCQDWVEAALGGAGIALADLTPGIALDSSRLPSTLHGDPVDRMIAATARALDATLVTADRRLLDYAAAGHLRARAA